MNTSVLTSVGNKSGPVLVPLTIQQYHAMTAAGILMEGDPIELIDGLLVRKDRRDSEGTIMTVGPRHSTTITRLGAALDAALAAHGFHSRQQQPVTLTGVDEPEPDVAIVAGEPEQYRDHHPGPADVRVVVEIADSSLGYDRSTKLELYAASGVPEYWIGNLKDNVVEIYQRPLPSDRRYQSKSTCTFTNTLSFLLDGEVFEVDLSAVF